MSAHYEWVIEELDRPANNDDNEIIDVNHAETYAEAVRYAKGLKYFRIGLVRDENSYRGGRSWVYVVDGRLPEFLTDAFGVETVRVPQKYRKQFSA